MVRAMHPASTKVATIVDYELYIIIVETWSKIIIDWVGILMQILALHGSLITMVQTVSLPHDSISMMMVLINDATTCAVSHCTHHKLCSNNNKKLLLLRIFARIDMEQLAHANKSLSFIGNIVTARNETLTN